MNIHRFVFLAAVFFLASTAVFAQNKFEGYNLFLDAPENQTAGMCALRYVPPTTDITVTDLNGATPMRVTNCGDQTSRLTQSGGSATLRASAVNYKWCFSGEDKLYRISFKGDQNAGQITYNWLATPSASGIYSVKDFGAIGDGKTDDTIAFKSALAYIASRNGGTLQIPEGDFLITSPLTLPSGINIQGVSGITSQAPTNNVVQANPSRIKLRGANRALFRIGECTENVVIRDLELYSESNEATSGVEAVGAFISSQNFYFERVVFQNFNRGLYAHALLVNNRGWQFDYIKFNHCRFVYERDSGIYTDIPNSDWKIEGCMFLTPKKTPTANADAMHFERAGMILIQDTFGGGFSSALGGTFLNILDSTATTVINSQTESVTASITYNAAQVPNAGDYSYPLTLIGCIFGDPIIFKARRTFVSTGNLYGTNTFQADERLRVYSTGDRFCYDGYSLGCGATGAAPAASNRFGGATIVFMTGQLDEGSVKGHQTFFGTDVQFGTPVQMPSFPQTALPAGKPNGSLVYCSNCRRNTTPCQSGGTGAPAMTVAGLWSCL